MKTKLMLSFVVAAAVACGGDGDKRASQQAYETVQEGSAAGVTGTINGPGEVLPPITGTNADTTTAFGINPATAATTATQTTYPNTLPPPMTSAVPAPPPPVYVPPAQPAPRPEPVRTPAPQPPPTNTDTATTQPPPTQTDTAPPPSKQPKEQEQEEPEPEPTQTDTTTTTQEPPPPPPHAARF
jgi:hypothetical protein